MKSVKVMKLYIVKPDLYFFDQYNDMMKERNKSSMRITPWLLDKPFDNLGDFGKFIQMLDGCKMPICIKNFLRRPLILL